jgi:CRP/FNR family transcriptional regulator/CRP/FNR family cyclic AMP-dependent transcriptional regulator
LFAGNALFGDLPIADQRQILGLCKRRHMPARRVVFNQGDPGREMYIVKSGRLKISVTSEEGRELSFFILGKGDIFGELALLDGERRSATVTAAEPSELLVLHHQDFRELLQKHQQIGLKLLSILAGRVRATTDLYESSVFIEIPGRLASRLLELADRHGVATEDGLLIDLKLSQYEWGTLVNASRESVNKQLKIWEKQGLLRISRGRILLLERHVLESLA